MVVEGVPNEAVLEADSLTLPALEKAILEKKEQEIEFELQLHRIQCAYIHNSGYHIRKGILPTDVLKLNSDKQKTSKPGELFNSLMKFAKPKKNE